MSGFLPENPGVLEMNVIAEIRRRFHVDKETITSLANTFNLSRPTIRKHLNTVDESVYRREIQPHPKLGLFHEQLDTWLEQEAHFPRKQRRTAQRLYECLQVEGYCGSYRGLLTKRNKSYARLIAQRIVCATKKLFPKTKGLPVA